MDNRDRFSYPCKQNIEAWERRTISYAPMWIRLPEKIIPAESFCQTIHR